jgi:L-amino acid N-acyltransferase YncA
MIARARQELPPLPLVFARQQYHRLMRIRLAELADAEAIRTIYNVEVTDSTNTFDMVPRSGAEQEAWILRHSGVHPAVVAIEHSDAGVEGLAGANGEIVLGFGSLSPFRERSGYSATAENSVYVDRTQRGRGVGRALLAELLELASAHGFHSVIARIAGHNELSIGLHTAAGFELVGVEREVGRKHRQWLDVVELQRLL